MHDLRRGRHCLIGDRPINDLLVELLPLFNQMCLDVIDVTNACAIHPLRHTLHTAAGVPHTGNNCNKSMAEIKITLVTKFQMAINRFLAFTAH